MNIAIVTDSTCDLPREVAEDADIHVVPAHLNIGLETYRDGIDITREAFYERLPTLPDLPRTSAPAPGVFEQLYRGLLNEAEAIVSVHVASTLSSIYNVARIGAASVDAARISVVDSGQVSMGLGWAVLAAAEARRAGEDLQSVLARITETLQRVRVFAILNTMEYLKRSGRVGWAQAGIGELLRIKPLVELREGEVFARARIRTWSKAVASLAERVRGMGRLRRLALLHSNCPACVEDLVGRISDALPLEPSMTVNVNPVLGTHVGPHGLGVAVVLSE